jgi:soluble epoxide hydrolase/lipid-phosphate phosphatase
MLLKPESFQHRYCRINGTRYHYVDEGFGKEAVLLLHGWPDLWFGYRYQIVELKKQYRVICPDLVGFGLTDKPDGKQSLEKYTFRSVCADLVELLEGLGISTFHVIGHDWGGMLTWRMAQYHPSRVMSMVSICTAFQATHPEYIPLDTLIEKLPNLAYQKLLSDSGTDEELNGVVDDFFDSMFQCTSHPFLPKSVLLKWFVPKNKLSIKVDMTYHKEMYKKGGFHGPLNWYRTRKLNHFQEKESKIGNVKCPAMLVVATRDEYLVPAMAKNVQKHVPQCVLTTIDSTHWAMVEKPDELNSVLKNWLNKQLKHRL